MTTIGSLCSGYGGLDLAAEALTGGRTVWHSEIEPAACRILEARWPGAPNLGDLEHVDWASVERPDVITAGFPCQDLSYAGKGAGIVKGTRSGLWHAIADIVGVLRPGLLLLENVAAIVGRRPGLDVVAADLARLGFDAEWTCLRASDVGACHRRERWFCAAWPADTDQPRPQGTEPAGRHVMSARGTDPQLMPTPRVQTGGGAGADAGWAARENIGGPDLATAVALLPTPNASDERNWTYSQTDHQGSSRNLSSMARQQLLPTPTAMDSQASGGKAGSADVTLTDATVRGVRRDWGVYEAAIERHEAAFGRAAPSPTEPTPKTGKPRLAPPFVEWMMMLPEGWVTDVEGVSRNAQLKMLGNGVVPLQAYAGYRHLLTRP